MGIRSFITVVAFGYMLGVSFYKFDPNYAEFVAFLALGVFD